MTCAAAIADLVARKVWMGADTQKTSGGIIGNDGESKVWVENRMGKKWLFAESGTLRHLQLCRYCLTLPETQKADVSNLEFLITSLVPSIKATS